MSLFRQPAPTPHTVVVGLQFGDEGKGQTVDRLAAEHDLIVRYNGGANAGHSVFVDGERFALHLIPSGIVHADKQCVIANGVALDPFVLLEEIAGLRERGVTVAGNLAISDRAHLVLPWHRTEEALLEVALARTRGEGAVLATTRRGIGPAYADKALRATALRVCDLADPAVLEDKVAAVARIKGVMLRALADELSEAYEPLDAGLLSEQLAAAGRRLMPFVTDTTRLIGGALRESRVLFEGAHAAMLDIEFGTYPFVTSSHATALGVHAGAGVPAAAIGRVVGVMKAYTSRVGAGPFATELADDVAEPIRQRGGEFGTTTGRPRRIGWLDLPAVRASARLNGVTDLVVTGLGVLSGQPELAIGTGYQLAGEPLDAPPADAAAYDRAVPVLESAAPWAEPLGDCRSVDDLPAPARRYLERIAGEVAPVRFVCVGRERDQMLPVG